METKKKAIAIIGVVVLCACIGYALFQVVPISINTVGLHLDGTASPVGNSHSDGTAWANDPAGGSIGLPDDQ